MSQTQLTKNRCHTVAINTTHKEQVLATQLSQTQLTKNRCHTLTINTNHKEQVPHTHNKHNSQKHVPHTRHKLNSQRTGATHLPYKQLPKNRSHTVTINTTHKQQVPTVETNTTHKEQVPHSCHKHNSQGTGATQLSQTQLTRNRCHTVATNTTRKQ